MATNAPKRGPPAWTHGNVTHGKGDSTSRMRRRARARPGGIVRNGSPRRAFRRCGPADFERAARHDVEHPAVILARERHFTAIAPWGARAAAALRTGIFEPARLALLERPGMLGKDRPVRGDRAQANPVPRLDPEQFGPENEGGRRRPPGKKPAAGRNWPAGGFLSKGAAGAIPAGGTCRRPPG